MSDQPRVINLHSGGESIMTSWNYRVIRKRVKVKGIELCDVYGIHEVYYDENRRIIAWSSEPVYLGFIENIDMVKDAFNKPTLTLLHEESLIEE